MEKKSGLVASFSYKFIERVGVKLTALVINIVLARLLAPELFGTIAIVMVLVELFRVFVLGGLNTALIQTERIQVKDYSTVFWMSFSVATVCYIGLFVASPYLAAYYNDLQLSLIIRVLALDLFIGAFNSVQIALLSRDMKFKAQMVGSLTATIIAGVIGIGMAMVGFGIWALVVYQLLSQIMTCLTFSFAARWVPKFEFSWKRAKELFSYGGKILLSNFLYSLYTNVRSLIIGKKYSAKKLAYYDKGNQFPNVISSNIDTAIQSVMLPALSKKQKEPEKILDMMRRMVKIGTYILFPVLIGMACASQSIVYTLLTEKWSESVPYMAVFCIGYLFLTVSSSCNVAIKAIGKASVYAKNQALRLICMFTILFVSVFAFDNVFVIAVGYSLSLFIEMILAVIPARKYIGYKYGMLFLDIGVNFMISVVMGICVLLIYKLKLSNILTLVLQIVVGVTIYLALSIITKNKTFFFLFNMIRQILKNN